MLLFRRALGRRGEYAGAAVGARVGTFSLSLCAGERGESSWQEGTRRARGRTADTSWQRFARVPSFRGEILPKPRTVRSGPGGVSSDRGSGSEVSFCALQPGICASKKTGVRTGAG